MYIIPIEISNYGSFWCHADGLVRDCNISSALAMEILQSCAKSSICWFFMRKNGVNSLSWDLFSTALPQHVHNSVRLNNYLSSTTETQYAGFVISVLIITCRFMRLLEAVVCRIRGMFARFDRVLYMCIRTLLGNLLGNRYDTKRGNLIKIRKHAWPIELISCLLMTWRREEPGYQQEWYWPNSPEISYHGPSNSGINSPVTSIIQLNYSVFLIMSSGIADHTIKVLILIPVFSKTLHYFPISPDK